MAYPIKPSLVIKSNRIDNQRIALPFANRVPHPQWGIQKVIMRASISIDLAHQASIFEQHDHLVRILDNFHRPAVKINSWHTRRKTAVHWIVRIIGRFFVRPKYRLGGVGFWLCPRSHRWLLLVKGKIGIRASAGGGGEYPKPRTKRPRGPLF